MKVRIITKIHPAILDPQGKAIETALQSLGIEGITRVRQGKLFDIEIDTENPEQVEVMLREAAEKILTNPILEDYEIWALTDQS